MALGERFRSGGARGIARSLQSISTATRASTSGATRLPGSGKLTITCQGCGETVSYNAAQVGEIGAFDLPEASPAKPEKPPTNGADPRAVPAAPIPERPRATPPRLPGPGPSGARPSDPGPLSGRALPRWLAPLAIGLVIAAGIAMILIGLSRSSDDGGGETATTQPAETQAEAPAQPAETAPAETQPAETAETAPAEPAAPAEPPATGGVALDTRSFGAFAIGIPQSWTSKQEADGATVEAPGATAAVTVFAGQSALSPLDFAREAEGFLADRRPGASVDEPKPGRFQGRPAALCVITYPGGEEQATIVSAGGFVFVLLKRVDRGASPQVAGEAEAALQSFNPR